LNTPIPPVANDPISKLPAEVQDKIWQNLDQQEDRASLALTCKAHAKMYHQLKEIPVKKGPNMVRRLRRPVRLTSVHRLKVLLRLRDWYPAKYRLCFSCAQLKDISNGRGTGWSGEKAWDGWGVGTKTAMDRGPRCRICTRRDAMTLAGHLKTFERYRKLAKSLNHSNSTRS
jgi:hypothetical protein